MINTNKLYFNTIRTSAIISIFTILFFTQCGNNNSKSTEKNNINSDSTISNKQIKNIDIVYDTFINDFAHYLVGDTQWNFSKPLTPSKLITFKNHAREMNSLWNRAYSKYLTNIEKWRDTFLNKRINPNLTLVYPFSGPDAIYPIQLYPQAKSIHMFALEPIKNVKNVHAMNDKHFDTLLRSIRIASRDILKVSYFITNHMSYDLSGNLRAGVMPLMLMMLAKQNYLITSVKFFGLDSNGNEFDYNKDIKSKYYCQINATSKLSGNKISLHYYSCNLSDEGINSRKGIIRRIESLGDYNMFMKAASYLIYSKSFSKMQQVAVKAKSIFQDDTGLPYRLYDSKKFNLILFGNYGRPISDFGSYTYQKDLEKYYKENASKVLPLPFFMGYHNSHSKQFVNYQLFISK